jgi:hypothetical protein
LLGKRAGIKLRIKVVFIFSTIGFLCACYSIQYTTSGGDPELLHYEKYGDLESYLDYFKAVEIEGIHINLEAGIKEISYAGHSGDIPVSRLSFIQISDVQLRDEKAQLWGRFMSKVADAFVGSVRFGRAQEKYDYAVFISLLRGLEGYLRSTEESKPAFLIHTGDSVHVSLVSELWEFLYILNECLQGIPWFDVVGNHDVTIFGTPTLGRSSRWKDPILAGLPINVPGRESRCSPSHFINFHRNGKVLFSGIPFFGPLYRPGEAEYILPPTFDPDHTEYHGFDMDPRPDAPVSLGPWHGYYAFDCRLKKSGPDSGPKKVRIVVLNTAEYISSHAQGGFSQQQVDWLADLVRGLPNKETRVIAFGHHPLMDHKEGMRADGVFGRRLDTVLELFRNHVDAYFCGHIHKQGYDHSAGFLQIFCPSLLEFPQAGHKIDLAYGSDSLCVSVFPFSHKDMPREDDLKGTLAQTAGLWEKDPMLLQTLDRMDRLWREDDYLKRRNLLDIVSLWERDAGVKRRLARVIPHDVDQMKLKQTVRKACLLKHAYLGRKAAAEDKNKKDFAHLGYNYRFILPMNPVSLSDGKGDHSLRR